ncbi:MULTISPECIES: hypothetical protein [unclassified Sphingopyxis]|jgi:hypothetical protein|uniref:hypothetical protein n=1 Tax=unclassified Sphingopyxis TaxID=2614943 RepID=UPI0006C3C976|nr:MULTISPECIES: hypothetical protein [unclassified Sphingopyxis]USI78956.1 hypothetical protein KEC45_08720 [Sphingopyxis sp. USTB-05]GAO78587.1 hypothetical protein SC1_01896 [Sphingopyxis sp. C-1]
MRKLLLATLIAPVLLAAPAASAFDPDTPVGKPKPAFPVTLGSEEDTTIGLAFRTAFGLAKGAEPTATREIDGRTYTFRPAAIHLLPNNVGVLLSLGSLDEAGHSEGGVNAIHYLQGGPSGWQRKGEWLDLGSVGSVGNAATAWAFSDAIGKNPYLITSGGGVWQGCAISSATLTELAPDAPADRASFTDSMSSGGGLNQKEQGFDGQITAAVPDKSFTVTYSGTRTIKQQYLFKNGKYELVGKDQIPGC